MLVSAFQKTQSAPLKVVNGEPTADAGETLLHAVNADTVNKKAIETPQPMLQVVDPQNATNHFTITFSYGQQLHRTKVLKVGAGYRKPEYVYKVALNSRLSNASRICWLQKSQQQGWNILLGDNLDSVLIAAITSAIESME